MKRSVLAITTALFAVTSAMSAAELSGKVTLKGTPPPEKTIEMDQTCGKLHTGGPIKTRHYLTGEGNGLQNVFVYVKAGAEGKALTATGDGPLLDQVNCVYEPYVIGVMTNQQFSVRNSDALLHNVHATPKANKEFNFAQAAKGQVNKKSFSTKEVLVRVKCDVHPWMFSYIGVLDHPYFAITDKDGNFKIANLPAGKYTVEAYHLKTHGAQPGVTQEITVDGDKKADFEVEVKAAP